MKVKPLALTIALLLSCVAGIGVVQADALPSSSKPQQGAYDMGILFNVPSILLELESYQGGLGFKLGSGPWAFRAGVDLMYNSAADSSNISGSFTVEYHILSGPVSPYVGGFASAGWTNQKDVMSEIPLSVGAMAGVEVFVFDFLSVYAEYALACDLALTQDLQTNDWSKSLLIDSRLGNSGTLGIVVYFMRKGAEKK